MMLYVIFICGDFVRRYCQYPKKYNKNNILENFNYFFFDGAIVI